ncbi:AI-2E family transporter [Amphibacillus sp. MSJ-3]|nr:AI-2E family transporter [Amphibacillus sp. MSJ-3]MBU5593548.1 AI-2E family transporter [Amphibacillus sp. MSJ-3]
MICLLKLSAVSSEVNSENRSLIFNKLVRFGVLAILFLIILFLIVRIFPNYHLFLNSLYKIVFPFVLAILLTYLLNPIVGKLTRRFIPRWLAILIIYFTFVTGLALLIYFTYPIFMEQLKKFIDQLPLLLENYRNWINQLDQMIHVLPEPIHGELDELINKVSRFSATWLENKIMSLSVLSEFFVSLVVVPVLLYYFLLDRSIMKSQLMNIIPKRYQKQSKQFIFHLNQDLADYIRAQLIISLFVGGTTYIVYLILKIEFSLLLAIFMAVMNIIPYFGPILGAIPAVLIALTTSTSSTIYLIIGIFLVQIIESNILSPFIFSYSLRTHPVLVILALLIGSELAGIVGMIIAIPALVVIRSVITYYPFQK